MVDQNEDKLQLSSGPFGPEKVADARLSVDLQQPFNS